MSNWNGVGVPGNGQRLAHELGGAINKFIGVNSAGDWVAEDGGNFPRVYAPHLLKPIKTPEQAEEEKAIGDIDIILGMAHMVNKSQATVLHEAGYHNQPTIKPLSWEQYYDLSQEYAPSKRFIHMVKHGHIIEAKKKDS